jgi:hypothetical protein
MAGCGYWRYRYSYQEPTRTVDSAGQASLAWTELVVVSGSVTPNQREVIDDLGVAIRTDVTLETAFHPLIKATGRLVELSEGATYNISGVVDPDGGKCKRLRINASEVR